MKSEKLVTKNNTTLYFGIFGGIFALIIGYLGIGFHLVYLPPVVAAVITIIIFTKKIDSLKPKTRTVTKYILFGFFIAFSTLFLAALSGSAVLFIMSLLEFLNSGIFKFGLNYFDAESYSFVEYFSKEGMKYLLAPMYWVLIGGLMPSLIFGLIYGLTKCRSKN